MALNACLEIEKTTKEWFDGEFKFDNYVLQSFSTSMGLASGDVTAGNLLYIYILLSALLGAVCPRFSMIGETVGLALDMCHGGTGCMHIHHSVYASIESNHIPCPHIKFCPTSQGDLTTYWATLSEVLL